MKKQFVVKDLITNQYFVGFYTSGYFSASIVDAKQLQDEEEAEGYILQLPKGIYSIDPIFVLN